MSARVWWVTTVDSGFQKLQELGSGVASLSYNHCAIFNHDVLDSNLTNDLFAEEWKEILLVCQNY